MPSMLQNAFDLIAVDVAHAFLHWAKSLSFDSR
jgi:hypothetical protein